MNPFPLILQHDKTDCGPCCLKMIAQYYGKDIPITSLVTAMQPTSKGVSLFDINEAALALGFQTQAIKISLNELEQQGVLPLIAHWRHIHFIVVYKISPKKIYVADPARGLTTYTKKEFADKWATI